MGRGDDAVKTGLSSEVCQRDCTLERSPGEADLGERRGVEASKNGDSEEERAIFAGANHFAGGAHHGWATGGVKSKHADSPESGCGPNRAPNRVRNVVEFQIEEDAKTKARKHFDGLRAFGCKELAADFEIANDPFQFRRQGPRGAQAGNIEGDD